jgi:hypothetical protein
MGEPERRRRRLRPPSSAAAPAAVDRAETPAVEAERPPMTEPVAETSAVADPADEDDERTPQRPGRGFPGRPPRSPGSRPTSGAGVGGDDREAERGLRGLVGSGSSQVSVGAALRARDAARPTEAQLADAEQNVTIVRRNWSPREDLPRNR